MATVRTSRLEAIQFTDDGTILVRIQKRTIVDGEILKEEWHRTVIPPGTDPVAQMAAVNSHLVAMGYSAVPADVIGLLATMVNALHTEEVVKAFVEKNAEQSV